MKIGETVRLRIGEDIIEGVVVNRSDYDYFGDDKGYSYKIRTKSGTIKRVSGIIENVFGFMLEGN